MSPNNVHIRTLRFVKTQNCTNSKVEWYVLRVTYQRELVAKRYLDERGIENFVPIRTVQCPTRSGRKVTKPKALLHNYIFVHSTREVVDDLKQFHLPYLRYVMHTQNSERQVMVVPEEQMHSFILIAGSEQEGVELLPCQEVELNAGQRVIVTGGLFAGAEGVLTRIIGKRAHRVVVRIEGIAAVAAPTIPSQFIEIIE